MPWISDTKFLKENNRNYTYNTHLHSSKPLTHTNMHIHSVGYLAQQTAYSKY